MILMTSKVITYSSAYTLVPTYECFNRCTYCNFRHDIGTSGWISLELATLTLRSLPTTICETLILSGEVHPQSRDRMAWFEHLYVLCERAIELGFLPHTNVGPLSYPEMARLKTVNVSMGLMLEQSTPHLLDTVHRHAPSKNPALRLHQLRQAGELKIPFTTGILVGLGETADDRVESLKAIAQVQREFGHLQECILQPYSPGTQETWMGNGFDLRELPTLVAIARDILPINMAIQIPPNLVTQPSMLLACLEAGASDLGGISPIDEVNPDYPHPSVGSLSQVLKPAGWSLEARLPVYSQYIEWLTPRLKEAIALREQTF
ncbi:MAG: 7,8-didemethyl-8-hydroxy-5-deazariboflavin synthase subunit CofG [Alkalinema sp. FL-bin-369]|nr:7,8-didemethyl-8-hydroxy-5-deazariboflavin synthase subunit CofG [Leptolyngbyaceae cyanobacterium LF-bin-369]